MIKENSNTKKEFHDLQGEVLRIGKYSDKALERAENHLFPSTATAQIILTSLKDAQAYPTGTRLYHFRESKNSLEEWQKILSRFGARAKFFSSLKIKIGHDVQKTEFEIDANMLVLYISGEDLKYIIKGLESHVEGTPYFNVGLDALIVSSTWP